MARTDWTTKDTVRPADMNQIGQEINDLGSSVTVWLGVTEGTDTEYTVTSSKVSSLFEGLRVSFRAHVASGANPTLQIDSLGAVPLNKPNGRAAKLDADGVYTAVYSAASFTLQGEGGEYGTATAADVLAPKTIGTDEGLVTGTIPTRGEEFKTGDWSNPDGDSYIDTSQRLDGGYYPPNTKVTTQIYAPTLIPKNVKSEVEILGVKGDPNVVDTSDAIATAGDMLSGKTGYVQGNKITGNIPVLTGIRTATGTAKWGDGALAVYPERGYQKGGAGDGEIKVPPAMLQQAEPNLQPMNIPAGINMFGIGGTYRGVRKVVTGLAYIGSSGGRTTVDLSSYGILLNRCLLNFKVRTYESNLYRTCVMAYFSVAGATVGNVSFQVGTATGSHDILIDYELVEFDGVKRRFYDFATRNTSSSPMIVSLPVTDPIDPAKTLVVGSFYTNQSRAGRIDGYALPSSQSVLLYGSMDPGYVENWYYQLIEFY